MNQLNFVVSDPVSPTQLIKQVSFAHGFEIPSLAYVKSSYIFGSIAEPFRYQYQTIFNYYSFIIHFNI